MSLWRMAWVYLWRRPLVTLLTLVAVALGTALICGVLTLRRETEKTFMNESSTFDLVVGAKGSPLQLVLSSIYHLDIPTGNIPWPVYEKLKKDKRLRAAVPLGLGDNHRGFRIIGTLPEFFELGRRVKGSKEMAPLFEMAEGRVFTNAFEAVLGAQAARQTGLGLGDTFHGSHGLMAVAGTEEHTEFPFTVTGILKPSGTSNDRAMFTPIESVWRVHEKEAQAHREKAKQEVTAVLVQLKAVGLRMWIADDVQKNTNAMAAIPVNEMLRMFKQVLGPMQKTLLAVAYLVVAVASLTILATLYQGAERRRRDVAVMRALGAHPREILFLVIIEALLLTLIGIAAGWLIGHGGVHFASARFQDLGLAVQAWTTDRLEWISLGIVLAAGLVAGFVPALLNYRRSPVRDLGLAG